MRLCTVFACFLALSLCASLLVSAQAHLHANGKSGSRRTSVSRLKLCGTPLRLEVNSQHSALILHAICFGVEVYTYDQSQNGFVIGQADTFTLSLLAKQRPVVRF